MALEQAVNAVETTTAGTVNNSSDPVTVAVTSAAGFPTTGNFRIRIDDELLLVTAVSGTDFTCTRAIEGTTIASHASGAKVSHVLTKESLIALIDRYGYRPYPRFTPSGIDDEFDDESFSGWTAVGTTPTPTVTEKNSQLAIYHPGSDSAARFYSWMKAGTMSNGDYIELCFREAGYTANHIAIALIAADGNTYNAGAQMTATWVSTQSILYAASYTNYNSFSSLDSPTVGAHLRGGHFFMRLQMTAANTWRTLVSANGVAWAIVTSSASRTLTPTHLGFGVSRWGDTHEASWSLEYFRKGS